MLRGIREALRVGLKPVKLNTVVFRRTVANIPRMIDFVGSTDGLKLQLIQFMPELVDHRQWVVDMRGVKQWLEKHSSHVYVRDMHHRRVYIVRGAEVEVVDPVYNREFCSHCHRIRVTHRGELKGCLNRNDDLIPTRGLDDAALREAFRRVITTRVPYYGGFIKEIPRLPPTVELPPELPLASGTGGST